MLINNSNLSVIPFFDLWYFAKGHIIYGWSIKNVGFTHSPSIYSATNLSINLDGVLGLLQGTFNSLHKSSKYYLASGDSRSVGNFLFKIFSNSSIIDILLHGLEKSISIYLSFSTVILNFKVPLTSITILHNISSVMSNKSL